MKAKHLLWMLMVAGVAKESEGAPNKEPAENADSLNVDRMAQLTQEIKLLKHENKDAKQEINLLKESIRVDKRRSVRDDKIHGIERMNRNAEEADGGQMEEMIKGKIDSISGRKNDETTRRAKDDKFELLKKELKKYIDSKEKSLTETINSTEKNLRKTINSNEKTLREKIESQGKSLTADINSIEKSLTADINSKEKSLTANMDSKEKKLTEKIDSATDKIDSAIANQVRCLSGYQELKFKGLSFGSYEGRVTFDPAFSGTPDICFAAFNPYMVFQTGKSGEIIMFVSKSVKPTHVDFKFKSEYHSLGVQWMACGRSNRGMTAEMLLDLKLNE